MVQRRTCEICGVKEVRADKSLRFSRFPFNESICKKWVAACGKEDLVSLPIEKINKNRYVCWNHFATKYKLKRQLKKRAIPTLNLLLAPLTENQMVNFPQHLYRNTLGDDNEEHDYSDIASGSRPDSDQLSVSEEDQPPEHETGTKVNEEYPPPELETGKKASEANEFTWENNTPVLCDQELEIQESSYIKDVEDISMFGKEVASAVGSSDDNYSHQRVPDAVEGGSTAHEWYKCNECSGDISGLRYTCVECADFDLCCSCESRGAHAAHYVLRVPGPRSHSEIQSVLTTIRRLLLNTSFTDEVLNEVKEEPEDPICVEPEPPALEADGGASTDTDDSDYQEEYLDNSTSSDEDVTRDVRLHRKRNIPSHTSSPRRKRKRVEYEASSVNNTPSDDTRIQYDPLRGELTTSPKPNTNLYCYFDKKKQCVVLQSGISKDALWNSEDASDTTHPVGTNSPTQPVDTNSPIQPVDTNSLTEPTDTNSRSHKAKVLCNTSSSRCKIKKLGSEAPMSETSRDGTRIYNPRRGKPLTLSKPSTNQYYNVDTKTKQYVRYQSAIPKYLSRNINTAGAKCPTQSVDTNSPTQLVDARSLIRPEISLQSSVRGSIKRVESKAISVSNTAKYNLQSAELVTSTKPNTDMYYNSSKMKGYVVLQSVITQNNSTGATSSTRPVVASRPTQPVDASSPTQPVDERDVTQTGIRPAQLLTQEAYVPLQRVTTLEIKAALRKL